MWQWHRHPMSSITRLYYQSIEVRVRMLDPEATREWPLCLLLSDTTDDSELIQIFSVQMTSDDVTTVFKVLNLSTFLLYSESLYSISIFKAFKLKYFLLKRKKMDRWKYFHFLLILYFLSYILFDNHSYFAGCSDDALMLSDKPWSFDLKLRLKEQYQSRDCCLVPQAALHSVYLCTM